MKRNSTLFLQAVVVLIGIVVLAVMIRFPLTEGRAAHLDLFSIYADPFILYGYLASIAFFVALYQALKLLGYVRQNTIYSLDAVDALRTIRYCAIVLSICIVMAALYIRIFHANGDDDPAGFVALSIVTTFISVVVATIASMFERVLQSRKSGNPPIT